MLLFVLLTLVTTSLETVAAFPHTEPFERWKRQSSGPTNSTQVDLGYSVYEGAVDSSTNLITFKGIRYASPPTGKLRWQAPQPPASNRSAVISAASFGPRCPPSPRSAPGAVTSGGNEDCLFLNVYAPQNATKKLPVFVWIHGGGYGQGDGTQDLSNLINANQNSFIGVAIQYRLGAFGFLAGDEVYRNGVTNAGILDQCFALQWVQAYIERFGGDPDRVTIGGVSAGAGSVMLLDTAYGGTLGTSLFSNSISASPFLPQQWGYKDFLPSQAYYAFATVAGCAPKWAYGNSSQSIFQCLVSQSTENLQNASALVSRSGIPGTWAFVPVTDGTLIQSTPSQALLQKKVNGFRQLTGNNAQEGDIFVPQDITTEDDLAAWLQLSFPLLQSPDITKILSYYPPSNETTARFATAGDSGPTAVGTSQTATGNNQRANLIYGETTFVCPSYWLADAYTTRNRTSFKYQYSVPIALHGQDIQAYLGTPGANVGPDMVLAFQRIWGNFITTGDPSIDSSVANGASSNSTMHSPLEEWPLWALGGQMANLNQTGGSPAQIDLYNVTTFLRQNATVYEGPGLRNNLRLVDAHTWEGGRGVRCDFWRSIAGIVPE